MYHQNANAKIVMAAIPPTTPPTIAPAFEDDEFGVEDAEVEDADDLVGVEAAAVDCDIADAGLDVTSFPFATKRPSFFAQQSRPAVREGSPQQRLPSAQIVKGCKMLSLGSPKSSVYKVSVRDSFGERCHYKTYLFR